MIVSGRDVAILFVKRLLVNLLPWQWIFSWFDIVDVPIELLFGGADLSEMVFELLRGGKSWQ